MSDREELIALRRMAELEEKSGQAAQSPKGGFLHNMAFGSTKTAADIGATLLTPVDFALNKLGVTDKTNDQRRADLKQFFEENADVESAGFKTGELATAIAGTAGVPGALASKLKFAPKLANAVASGGFNLGAPAAKTVAGRIGDAALRVGGGAVAGGASAGLINPDDADVGAMIGGALPVAAKGAAALGASLGGKISPEVKALYDKAKNVYGIDIPADRISNSKALNATASSLEYLPLSGRSGTMDKMFSQMNRALSRTFGQNSDNVTQALRKASKDLGGEFDRVLTSNTVKVTQQFQDDVQRVLNQAAGELSPQDAAIIEKQAKLLLTAPLGADINGKAAYAFKKTLDRIGGRNSNEAFYARKMKKALMKALNESLGPDEAAKFAKTRKQYGSMLDLENLAQNGAEGGISVARLANMKNINNPELQDLADIAAQFLRGRESPHGAAQRLVLGGLSAGVGTATGTLPLMAGAMAAGRGANVALNSELMKSLMLNGPQNAQKINALLANPVTRNALIQANATSP